MKEKEYFSEHGNWFSSLELDASWARSPWRSAETLRKSKIKMPCDDKYPSVFLTVDGKKYLFFNGWRLHWYIGPIDTLLGGVYMTPGATFRRRKLTPVPSLMTLYLSTWYRHKMSCRPESPRREFTPVVVPGREFHLSTKSPNSIM